MLKWLKSWFTKTYDGRGPGFDLRNNRGEVVWKCPDDWQSITPRQWAKIYKGNKCLRK